MALRATIKSLLLANSQSVQCQPLIRWKGHSKWQNIRHTKGEKDNNFAKLCHRYSVMIGIAVRENGMEMNPEKNKALKRYRSNKDSRKLIFSLVNSFIQMILG